MDALLSHQVDLLIARGSNLLNGLAGELDQIQAPGADVARDLIAEGLGTLAVDFFGTRKAKGHGKRITRAWLDGEKKGAVAAVTTRYYQQYQAWFRETSQFVAGVSINTPRLVAPGNSQAPVKKIRRAESFKRLDTRIRHVLTQLEELRVQELVWNHTLPASLPRVLPPTTIKPRLPDPSETLRNLESLLRRCIERELSKQTPHWWNTMIPVDVRGRAEGRKQRRETVWPWYPTTSTNITDYLDFSDYKKIILQPANWNGSFKAVFSAQSFIESKLDELDPIRHDIAHSRPLSADAGEKLRLYSREIANCVEQK